MLDTGGCDAELVCWGTAGLGTWLTAGTVLESLRAGKVSVTAGRAAVGVRSEAGFGASALDSQPACCCGTGETKPEGASGVTKLSFMLVSAA